MSSEIAVTGYTNNNMATVAQSSGNADAFDRWLGNSMKKLYEDDLTEVMPQHMRDLISGFKRSEIAA